MADLAPAAAAAQIALAARLVGCGGLVASAEAAASQLWYRTLWAKWLPAASHRVVVRHESPVCAITISRVDGRLILASADQEGVVRFTDLGSGKASRAPLRIGIRFVEKKIPGVNVPISNRRAERKNLRAAFMSRVGLSIVSMRFPSRSIARYR
jgi:hypothetical protein